jgi:hypothetical protein
VQGPPGTGKTHVIVGMVAMFLAAGARRIHICAPSNAAIEELMLRLSKLKCSSGPSLKNFLLRLAASDHESPASLREYELEERLKVVMREGEEHTLKDRIYCTNCLLNKIEQGKKRLVCYTRTPKDLMYRAFGDWEVVEQFVNMPD